MMAMDAYGIPASWSAATGAASRSSRAAGAAGTAMITASASRYSGSAADPTVSRQPVSVRPSSRTIAPVRTSAPDALATASGSAPSPDVSVTKRGAGLPAPGAKPAPSAATRSFLLLSAAGLGGWGGSSDVTASVSAAWPRVAAASGARVALNDRSSDRPAYTPPSSGSTSRSTISAPSLLPMYSVTETSTASAGRTASALARATPSGEITPVAASSSGSAGTPMNCLRGSGRIAPLV